MTAGRIEVAVVPAAGRGTRLLPATRSVPKAFIPIVDRPAVQHVVEEAVRAGATEVYVVVDAGMVSLMRSHFDGAETLPGLESVVVEPIIQEFPRGLGDAILAAEDAVAGRPFFCLLVDNLVAPGQEVLPRLARQFDGRSVLGLQRLRPDQLGAFGVVEPGPPGPDPGSVVVTGAIEKPGAAAAPSRLGIVGRYLLTSEIFEALRATPPGHGEELQLTDAIDALAARGRCAGYVVEEDLLDIGTPFGLCHASSVLGHAHPEWGDRFAAVIEHLAAIDRTGRAVVGTAAGGAAAAG